MPSHTAIRRRVQGNVVASCQACSWRYIGTNEYAAKFAAEAHMEEQRAIT